MQIIVRLSSNTGTCTDVDYRRVYHQLISKPCYLAVACSTKGDNLKNLSIDTLYIILY